MLWTMEPNFLLGIKRGFFNKGLKNAIEAKAFTHTQLRTKTGVSETTLSMIINFKKNPSEDMRIALAVALEVPIDDIFPEKYDELYERISPLKRVAHVEINTLRLNAPEVLMLEAPERTDELAIRNEFADVIGEELSRYSPKEQRVLEKRYGLTGNDVMTLEEVAKTEGVTRERIRQIEAKALERLRFADKVRHLVSE